MDKHDIMSRLPEHLVLRARRLRHPGGRPDVLRQGRQEAEPERVRVPRRAAQGRHLLRPGRRHGIDPAAHAGGQHRSAPRSAGSWILDEMVKDGHLTPRSGPSTPSSRCPNRRRRTPSSAARSATWSTSPSLLHQQQRQGIDAEQARSRAATRSTRPSTRTRSSSSRRPSRRSGRPTSSPKKRPDTDTHVQFGGASVEPEDGAIVAIYGGEDATKHFTNNADQTGAQVGSTFKPFVLAAAMQ